MHYMSRRLAIVAVSLAMMIGISLRADDHLLEHKTNDELNTWFAFDRASEKRLGSKSDLAAINALVLGDVHMPNPQLVAVRWVSASLTIVRANFTDSPYGPTRLLYIIEK